MSLHIKYRPSSFKEVIGQKAVVNSLKSMIDNDDEFPHAFLFVGPSGTGKTTLGRILAKEVGCKESDIIETNVANMRGIDYVREIVSQSKYKPLTGKSKVYILDEAHQLTKEAQNCMLKLIEDCPRHCYFIFCSTNPEKIIKTIQTRCSIYSLTKLNNKDIKTLIRYVCKEEGITLAEELFELIVLQANGTPRTALVLLNQIKDIENLDEACDLVIGMEGDEKEIIELCRMMISGKAGGWKKIAGVFKGIRDEPEKIRIVIVNYLSSCLLGAKSEGEIERISDMIEYFVSPVDYNTGKAELIHGLSKCFLMGAI